MGINTHHPISTLGPCQDQAGVRHVITQVNMRAPAQNPPPFLERDVCFYGNSVGTNYWAVSSSLTLDFATFRISVNRKDDRENRNAIIEQNVTFPNVCTSNYIFDTLGVQLVNLQDRMLVSAFIKSQPERSSGCDLITLAACHHLIRTGAIFIYIF